MDFHHAYAVIHGNADKMIREILSHAEPAQLSGHPDYFELATDKLGIQESRALRRWAYGRPVQGGKKVAVIITQSLTLEASNALLKIFEEPPLGTHFFICVPHVSALIPTLRSRVVVVGSQTYDNSRKSDFHELAQRFLSGSPKDRTDIIMGLEDGKRINDFVNELESCLSTLPEPKGVSEIMRVRTYLGNRGSSAKMLLDYLALTIPRL